MAFYMLAIAAAVEQHAGSRVDSAGFAAENQLWRRE